MGLELRQGYKNKLLAKLIPDGFLSKFKRSNSYRSELEDKTFEWLLKNQKGPQKREIQQMLKLIKHENRLDQKVG